MRVCRPQLYEKKQALLSYLKLHKIPYAVDHTNESSLYLRGRMRISLVPFLKQSFGKEIEENVLRQMEWFQQCARYLDQKIASAQEAKIEGPYGVYYPKGALEYLDPLEFDHLLFRAGVIRTETRRRVMKHWEQSEWGRNVQDRETNVFVEKAGLFFLQKMLAPNEKKFEFYPQPPTQKGWLSFWRGEIGYYFPEKTARWVPISGVEKTMRAKIFKRYSSQKTPIFLRKNVYVLENQGKVIYEFLSL